MGNLREYQVIGRKKPTEKEPVPKLYRMRLFAPNEVVAKSRYWYFIKKVNKVKKASGEIVSVNEIFERKPTSVKNFGIWLRYDSRSGTHNMYKEYRELSRVEAVSSCYKDMAARHRARFSSIHIIKVAEVKTADVRRPYIRQILDPKIKFPVPHRVVRASSKRYAKTFSAHDAQLDYYGRRLATCSSDRTIKIFEVDNETHRQVDVLRGHSGPVWQVAWAHPKFGNILASCSYDTHVYIWREYNGAWTHVKDHAVHTSSVNSISWAPHEHGLVLACASSDGKISVLTCKEDGSWESVLFVAHHIGVNAVSWAPATSPGSLVTTVGGTAASVGPKRFVSGGCDNHVKIWKEENGQWKEEADIGGHNDWVRDVCWAPNVGLPSSCIASCSQDKTVYVWTQEQPGTQWTKKPLRSEPFADVVWRVSWSPSGNVLAVSCGDNKVNLWKEGLDGEFSEIGDVTEGAGAPAGASG
ncbi:60S ribosomal protein L20, partial [Cladochytrium tenue]